MYPSFWEHGGHAGEGSWERGGLHGFGGVSSYNNLVWPGPADIRVVGWFSLPACRDSRGEPRVIGSMGASHLKFIGGKLAPKDSRDMPTNFTASRGHGKGIL